MHLARSFGAWRAIGVVLCVACVGAPPAPTPGRGNVFGDLRLMPREGVHMPDPTDTSYADPRLRDVSLVDYSKPGFAVVWLDGETAPERAPARVTIRENEFDVRLEPAWVAASAGATLALQNATAEAHTVSCPSLGRVEKIAPGETLQFELGEPGAHALFLLDRPQVEGGIFVAPGPYAVLGRSGRFELRDVAPGRARLHAFHPRFPPVALPVEVVPDQSVRVDVLMGVGRSQEDSR
jgi:plastocyanin